MAKLLSGTRVYGTANVDNVLLVGNITPVVATNTTSGSLIVTGGAGISGSLYANAVYSNGSIVLTSEPIANIASANTIITQGVDATQNTQISVIQGVDLTQNTLISNIQGVDTTQNTRLDGIEGTNLSQNTTITAVNQFAQGAYNTANNALPNTGGLITVNSASMLFVSNTTASTSNTTGALVIAGGVGISGNVYISGPLFATSYAIGGSPYINNNRTITQYGTTHNVLGSGSGSRTIDLALGNFVSATVTGATTWTFSNPLASPNAMGFVLKLTNGGSATQNWPSPSVKWPGGTAPTLTASGVDILTFVTDDGGTNWRGVVSMLDSK
jgi:hypothetical protein